MVDSIWRCVAFLAIWNYMVAWCVRRLVQMVGVLLWGGIFLLDMEEGGFCTVPNPAVWRDDFTRE
jgi:hypothetical protein